MKTFDVIVRDALGFTFCFSYVARSKSDAIAIFKKRCRRNGVTKFRNIKILSVEEVS